MTVLELTRALPPDTQHVRKVRIQLTFVAARRCTYLCLKCSRPNDTREQIGAPPDGRDAGGLGCTGALDVDCATGADCNRARMSPLVITRIFRLGVFMEDTTVASDMDGFREKSTCQMGQHGQGCMSWSLTHVSILTFAAGDNTVPGGSPTVPESRRRPSQAARIRPGPMYTHQMVKRYIIDSG